MVTDLASGFVFQYKTERTKSSCQAASGRPAMLSDCGIMLSESRRMLSARTGNVLILRLEAGLFWNGIWALAVRQADASKPERSIQYRCFKEQRLFKKA